MENCKLYDIDSGELDELIDSRRINYCPIYANVYL